MSNNVGPNSELLSGNITFYDSSLAPLKAGDYTLDVEQTIDLGPEGDNPPPYETTQALEVTAPRFNIQPTDLQSVFPPGNHSGNFAEALPHVVLTQDLPWARPIVPGDVSDNTPWLALLVVHESEADKVTPPTTATVAQLVDSSNNTVVPDLGDLPPAELEQSVQLMKVDLSYFLSIAPKLQDLDLLTHARDVDTTQKVTGLANGFWSVVVANRLPASTANEAINNTVYLISVEGHSQHLAGSNTTGTTINLAVLAQWNYTVSAFPGDFLSILQNIKATGQNQVLRLPSGTAPSDTEAEKHAEKAISLGFVPSQSQLLEGEQTTAWVRGVLTPWPNREDPLETVYAISDHAIRYDPKTGIFDFSYATAWQIGRLLALSDPSFTKAMQAWRVQQLADRQAAVENELVHSFFDDISDDASHSAAKNDNAKGANQRAALVLQDTFSKVPIPQIRQRRARACDNSAVHLPDNQAVKAAIEAGEDPLELVMSHLGYIEGAKE